MKTSIPRRGNTFSIVVVGAGLGGLLASIGLRLDGHKVTVLEQASTFGEIGAGIRISPNTFKILHRWGIDLTYTKKTYSNGNRFLRYQDGVVLAHMPHGIPEWDFGGSYLTVHRADYHEALLERAVKLGVEIQGASRVVDYDWDASAAILEGGASVRGDMIIIADGTCRPGQYEPQQHGDSSMTGLTIVSRCAKQGQIPLPGSRTPAHRYRRRRVQVAPPRARSPG